MNPGSLGNRERLNRSECALAEDGIDVADHGSILAAHCDIVELSRQFVVVFVSGRATAHFATTNILECRPSGVPMNASPLSCCESLDRRMLCLHACRRGRQQLC